VIPPHILARCLLIETKLLFGVLVILISF